MAKPIRSISELSGVELVMQNITQYVICFVNCDGNTVLRYETATDGKLSDIMEEVEELLSHRSDVIRIMIDIALPVRR